MLTCAPNVPNGKVYEGYRNRLRQEEWIDGIRVIRVWTFIAPNKGAARRILNYLSYLFSAGFFGLFLPRPDVLIATSPQFFCGLSGMLLAKLRRIPRILEIRDIWPESIEAVGAMKKSWITRLLERMEHFMYRSADHIVTVGNGYRDKLLERGVREADITVVTNGADLEFYKPGLANAEFRQSFGLEGKFAVAYVGTIGMASGLEVTIEAARKLREQNDDSIRFILVGDGAERENYESLAKKENLDSVVFAGRLDKALMPKVLQSVDVCLIHLRKSELFKTVLPSKLFEAFACARAVILGVDGSAKEVLDAANAGIFIEPGNADELIAAVKKLQQDELLRKKYEQNGMNHVRAFYDRDQLANNFLQVLETIANKSQHSH